MFGLKSTLNKLHKLEKAAIDLEEKIDRLEQERLKLKADNEQLADEKRALVQGNKLAENEIRHLVKIKEEKNAIELERKMVELEREQQKAIAEVKDKYQDKVEANLNEQLTGMKEMYGQILERLPDVNARLKIS